VYQNKQSVILRVEQVGGGARVTSDDERVQREGWKEISSYLNRKAERY